jgi:FlaA1/EpsC-like NDP-sugar epimerase
VPHEDIKVKFTGLMPGEKMYEEILDESETMVPTSNELLDQSPDMEHYFLLSSIINESIIRTVRSISNDFILNVIYRVFLYYLDGEDKSLNYTREGICTL